jgi:hypothetical protein
MARMIDLDLVAREPIQIRLQGKTFTVNEPTLEQLLRRDQLLAKLEHEGKDVDSRSDEENKAIIDTFDFQLLCIFLPWMDGEIYKNLTLGQKRGVYQLIFDGDIKEEEGEKKTEALQNQG